MKIDASTNKLQLLQTEIIIIIKLQQVKYQFPSFMEHPDKSNSQSIAIQVNSASKVGLRQLNLIQKQRQKLPQSYMPFLFKNKKFNLIKDTNNPAPGQYQTSSSFSQINSRDILTQKFQIVMENTKKIKESVVFKSASKRFNYKQVTDSIPISYSYRLSEASKTKSSIKTNKQEKRINKIAHKSLNNFHDALCPSIPDNSLKFGYVMNQGKLEKINKTIDQLSKQREAMKKYVKKLNGQKSYQDESQITCYHRLEKQHNKQILQKLKKKVENSYSLTQQKQNIPNIPNTLKFELKMSKKCYNKSINRNKTRNDKAKISKIMEQKQQMLSKLGPGMYDIKYNTFGNLLKPQKFQFFNSTSQRFCEANESMYFERQAASKSVKKMEIQNKMLQLRKTKSSNYWKRLRKPERSSDKSQSNLKQVNNPGPGDYSPSQQLVKAKLAKNSLFDKSIRFSSSKPEYFTNKVLTLRMKKEYKTIDKKILGQLKCGIQEPLRINMNERKNLMQQQRLRRQNTKGQSDYSICSWEHRPISRNQGFGGVLRQKQYNRNQN